MRKNLDPALIVYEADVSRKELEMDLKINRMRHRTKALRNEADGIGRRGRYAQRLLELKEREHARIANQARNTLQDLQSKRESQSKMSQGNSQHTQY